MKRRDFIRLSGLIAVLPRAGRAQTQPPTIGVLVLRMAQWRSVEGQFLEGLKDFGYIDGKTIQVELRTAEGNIDLLKPLAEELVELGVKAIVALFTPAVVAAKQATQQTPIVMIETADPLGMGLVASLSRPGGNLTGSTGSTSEMTQKCLELLHEALPDAKRIAVMINPLDPFSRFFLERAKSAAERLGIDIAQPAASGLDLEAAFTLMAGQQVRAILGQPSLDWAKTSELALRHNLPSVEPNYAYARAGGLLAYSGFPGARDDASYVDKILKGAKPADLPIRQPTRFNLVINLKTAKTLGLTIPPALLARADEVIE
jgi:putative tryptophan/tyrosine transport system substrate-binding protein